MTSQQDNTVAETHQEHTVLQEDAGPTEPGFLSNLLSTNGRLSSGPWFIISFASMFVPTIASMIAFSMIGWSLMSAITTLVDALASGDSLAWFIRDLSQYFPGFTMAMVVSLVGLFGGTWIAWVADIKRFHDMDKSGWLTAWRFTFGLPYVGQLIMLIYFIALLVSGPDRFDNEYGPGKFGRPRSYYAPAVSQSHVVLAAPQPTVVNSQALDVAKLRLASGEITVKEYLEIESHLR